MSSSPAHSSLLRSIIRRLGDSLSACVTSHGHYTPVTVTLEPNFFIAEDRAQGDAVDGDGAEEGANSQHLDLQDFDPSQLLDHWLHELDSARMDLRRNKTPLDGSFGYQRKYKRQRSMIDVGAVEDAELLEILEDLSDLELELEQEIEIVHQRQEEARRQLELKEKIKAENIQIAIEKIKAASIKKMYVKVFTSDGCAKSLLVDETMTAGQVTRILAEKNLVPLSPTWALVELAPDLHMERVYEDHELVVENCLLWRPESRNTLWFMERPEKFDIFQRPQEYFTSATDTAATRQELFDKYFSGLGSASELRHCGDTAEAAPPLEVSGTVWVKAGTKRSWSRQFCVLRGGGVYSAARRSGQLELVAGLEVNQVYYGVSWSKQHRAPTDFCFAVKHPRIQARSCKSTKYFCVDTEMELHRWVAGIRMVKHGGALCDNYRDILEHMELGPASCCPAPQPPASASYLAPRNYVLEAAEAEAEDTDDEKPVLTPTSDQNSFDSGVSSRAASDISELKARLQLTVSSRLVATEAAVHSGRGCGYTSDLEEEEEEELPPLPAQSVTSLHCPEAELLPPPPPGVTEAAPTLLMIPAGKEAGQRHFRPKEQAFRTFFEDVWFEESSYKA